MFKACEEYSYTKDWKEIKGFQYKVRLEFPQKEKLIVLLLCGHIGIMKLAKGNTEIWEGVLCYGSKIS